MRERDQRRLVLAGLVVAPLGVGLRLGNARASGFGRMLHIDLAFPLDGGSDIRGTQLLIEAKRSF